MVKLGLILSTGRTGTQFFKDYLTKTSENTLCLHEPKPSRKLKLYSNKYLQAKIGEEKICDYFNRNRKEILSNTDLENYIESNKYPNAKFKGKIIEDIDFAKTGKYKVRAKGKFFVHGKENPMTIRCNIEILKNEIRINGKFIVYLKDHNIQITTIVHQKLSEKINVTIKTTLKQKK